MNMMTQGNLDRAVARATGETVSTIRRLGFSLAAPDEMRPDPEPFPQVVDWDALDAQRVSYFPQRQPRLAAA